MKVLVAEDEKQLNKMICDYLESLGWTAVGAHNGVEALDLFRNEAPDFILLDVLMPGLDGLDVIRRIRDKSEVPIMFITARAEESDKLIGLELGADDYITKPFSLKEMAARIRAVMRRIESGEKSGETELPVFVLGDLELDSKRRIVRRGGETLSLTAVQFDILCGFIKQPERVFTRSEVLGFFLETSWEGYERTIDVHIKNIRKVLEPDRTRPRYLQTVRGVGYRLSDGSP